MENENYGLRLEKKIDTLQSEIRTLTDHITRHTFVNEANQHKIFGWAAHKYGLAANLPSGHPYKNNPPVV